MAYEKQSFADGEPLYAEQLEDIEDAIIELEKNQVGEDKIAQVVETALTEAKESGEFKGEQGEQGIQGVRGEQGEPGEDGKSAYEYARDGGYAGTEQEFTEELANLFDLKFRTVTQDEYDALVAAGEINEQTLYLIVEEG